MAQWKKILIGFSFVLNIIFIIGIISMVLITKYADKSMNSSRDNEFKELEIAGVISGKDIVSKKLFFLDERLGAVTDIAFGKLDKNPGIEIGIAGKEKVSFVDKSGSEKSSVYFDNRLQNVEFIDIDSDGISEFIDRAGPGIRGASFINHNVNILWTYGGWLGAANMAVGDINNDKSLEFAIGFTGGKGILLLDKHGKKIWKKRDANVWHVEMVDTNNDGKMEIVHSNASGELTIRNGEGNIIKKFKPPAYFSHFSIIQCMDKKEHKCALFSKNNYIWMIGFDGNVLAKYDAPKSGDQGEAKGIWIKTKNDNISDLIVLVDIGPCQERSVLYIYNPSKQLIYQEILPESCMSLKAISNDNNTQSFYVGCSAKVWKYDFHV